MVEPAVRERLTVLIDGAREVLQESGEFIPSLLVEDADGDLHLIDLAIEREWSRSVMYALGRSYGRRARALYFIADAWTKALDLDSDEAALRDALGGGQPVSEMPGRTECLIAVAMTSVTEGTGIMQRYDRTAAGIVFQEPEALDEKEGDSVKRAFVLEPFWRGAAGAHA